MPTIKSAFLASVTALALAGPALAQSQCTSVRMSDVGWTDITATTSLTRQMLEALGYDVDVDVLGVPVTFASVAAGDLDVFLGNWMPSQDSAISGYLAAGTIETVKTNLQGTKFNLAVPKYLSAQGLRTYEDLPKFADQLDSTIYGIEPGNESNEYIISLTQPGKLLEGWTLVQSSEQGMLAQVSRFYPREKPVVFIGWAPHPMNTTFDIDYLQGGAEFFGEEGVVNTIVRKGFQQECPNVIRLLSQQEFTLPMENEMMAYILDDGMDADDATVKWVSEHPEVIEPWLAGVTTVDGQDGLAVVKEAFGL
ncbi:choline ABC transporter substrate-binding protein [Falsirhodobacter sp. alg1]|uniref:choline ABC transporter substrate-binding protein n=1 Tax=Falsirhodobacter sp. alg1 TaxID=1472418 RepID=UPI0005F00521|nr:choline ABC transporter substrate-binding protein [Falsirhodobacter sp. alg1]